MGFEPADPHRGHHPTGGLLGDLHARVTFGVVNIFIAPIVLGTSYIDGFIAGILPLEGRIVPVHSRLVATLASYSYDKATNIMGTAYSYKDYSDI